MWIPDPDAVVTDLGDELVLLAPDGELFSLNASGRAAWLALPTDLGGVAAVFARLGASPAQAQTDAVAWAAQLQAQGLLKQT